MAVDVETMVTVPPQQQAMVVLAINPETINLALMGSGVAVFRMTTPTVVTIVSLTTPEPTAPASPLETAISLLLQPVVYLTLSGIFLCFCLIGGLCIRQSLKQKDRDHIPGMHVLAHRGNMFASPRIQLLDVSHDPHHMYHPQMIPPQPRHPHYMGNPQTILSQPGNLHHMRNPQMILQEPHQPHNTNNKHMKDQHVLAYNPQLRGDYQQICQVSC
jgi:hypothetical protein